MVSHIEDTAQLSEWLNISDAAKKLCQGKSTSGIAVVITTKLQTGLKAEVRFYQKSKGRRRKGKTRT